MSEERLEIIKENVYMRSEIAKNSRIGIDTSLREELELLKEIDRLNNIINQADTKNLELIQKINKIYDVIENENITGIEARLLIQDILDKENK